jgi:hypothetical protein
VSNALAIASVTRALMDLLNDGLIDNDVSAAVGSFSVSALPPDRVPGGNGSGFTTQLNLFLHQVTTNAGWQNADVPTRDARGNLVQTPRLALDLHYLLTAYGAAELDSEIILGYAMQVLHETPIIGRQALRTALAGAAVNGGLLPPAFQALAASDLADQVELIKVVPEPLSVDDMSKLWTALQTHYRTTTGYRVSVVLIDSERPLRSPLPVLTRGPAIPGTGRDRGVVVQPSLLPPFPTLESLQPANRQIVARLDEVLTLTGHHLDGVQVFARFVEPRTRLALELPALAGATPIRVGVQLPPDPPAGPVVPGSPLDPASWQAGAYNVSVRVQRAGQPDRLTNELPLALAPRIVAITAVMAAGRVTFTVDCSPPVRSTQTAALVVDDRALPAQPMGAPSNPTLTFVADGFVSGAAHWVRLRVDAVESVLIDRSSSPPRFDPTQQVTIP